jgi:hypothetical protein
MSSRIPKSPILHLVGIPREETVKRRPSLKRRGKFSLLMRKIARLQNLRGCLIIMIRRVCSLQTYAVDNVEKPAVAESDSEDESDDEVSSDDSD